MPLTTSTPSNMTGSQESPHARSGNETTSALARFLIPSVADLIFLILLVTLTCGTIASRLLDDAGIGWHIRNGQQILQTHAVTRTDPFSVSTKGKAWYAWEWLYDLSIAAIHARLGLNGVVFFTAALIAATFALALRVALTSGGSLLVTVALLVLAISASSIHFFARPHVLSWLLVVIWFRILDAHEVGTQKHGGIFWLPVLTLIWANLHGGFLVGFVLLGIYLIAGAVRYLTSRSPQERQTIWRRVKRLGLVAALSLAASLVNPYGYQLHVHIYQYLSDRFLMNHIDEFLSPNFHGMPQKCFAVLVLITIMALAGLRGRIRPSQLLVVIFAVYSGLYASRNLPVSSILLTLVIAPLLFGQISKAATGQGMAPWLRKYLTRYDSFASRMTSMEGRFRGHLWPVAAMLLGLWVSAHGGLVGSSQVINVHFGEKRFPVQAADVIEQSGVRQPVFAPDYWGGYLIYRLYPRTKVFVDDRHDLYGDQFFKDYLKVVLVQPDWEKVLDEDQVNWVLVPAESSLANILKLSSGWKTIYEDKTAGLFEKQH
jgi:hypothetical protein